MIDVGANISTFPNSLRDTVCTTMRVFKDISPFQHIFLVKTTIAAVNPAPVFFFSLMSQDLSAPLNTRSTPTCSSQATAPNSPSANLAFSSANSLSAFANFSFSSAVRSGTRGFSSLLWRLKWKVRIIESASSTARGRTSAMALRG